jgi:hypothetical protein
VKAIFSEAFASLAEKLFMDYYRELLEKVKNGEHPAELLKALDCNNPNQGG